MSTKAHVLILAGATVLAALPAAIATAAPVTVTDISGHTITLDEPADRIVLGEGRLIVTLGLIDSDPVALLAGWTGDYLRQDPGTYAVFQAAFPGIASVPLVGDGTPAGFSVEQTIAVDPDVVVFAGENSPVNADDDVVRQIEAAGIPVVFVDFFQDPLANTVPSIEILGDLIGRPERAAALAAFYQDHLDRIASRLTDDVERPDVFMEAHVGLAQECCYAPGNGTLGDFVDFAGGHNIGADVLPGPTGQLNLEYILTRDAPIYVGTGGAHLARVNGLVMGPGYDDATVREAMARMLQRPGIADLSAVESGRVYAIWHLFNDTPLSIIAIEALAKFIHPELFADIDPQATLEAINQRFFAIDLAGTYWFALNP